MIRAKASTSARDSRIRRRRPSLGALLAVISVGAMVLPVSACSSGATVGNKTMLSGSSGAGGGSAAGSGALSTAGGSIATGNGGAPNAGGVAAVGTGASGTSMAGAGGGSAATSAGGATQGGAGGMGGTAPGGGAGDAPEGGSTTAGGAGTGGVSAMGGMGNGGGEGGAAGDSSGDPRSPGCDTEFPTPPPKNEQQVMQIGGDSRYYLMEVPSDADNRTPLKLVFALHGFDMNNIAVVDLFNFTQRSGGTAITVWPQGEGPHPGTESHWGDGVLESTWSANDNNYAFLQELISDLGERYCIDRERIFITGFSMGGFFTNQIACAHSDWFRAFAPVAGGGPQSCGDSTVRSAIMVQHGTQDPIVDISSGEDSRDFWIGQNGCGASSTMSLNNCNFYEGCPEDKPVAWCTGSYDHYIPGEAASNVWSFFSSF